MTRCYLCHSGKIKTAFVKNGYTYVRCQNCGLYRLVLQEPYQKFLNRYYEQGYFCGDPDCCAYVDYWGDRHAIQKNMRVYRDQIKKFKTRGKLLDVGCSMGLFLELAQEAGFDSSGIDVSEYALRQAKKRFAGQVWRTELAKANFPNRSFDVITLFDVLEHLQDPRRELKKAQQLLKDDGILVFETGNLESFWARRLGRNWHFFAPPQHLYAFGASHLETLLDQAGFTIALLTPHNKWITLRYLLHLASSIGQIPGTAKVYRLLNQTPLAKWQIYLPLRDKVIVVAKKKNKQLITRPDRQITSTKSQIRSQNFCN